MFSKSLFRLAIASVSLLVASAGVDAQTPDSAFAVSKAGQSLFRVNIDAGLMARGAYDGDGSGTGIPIEGSGTRMMWYPRKGAFRAGGINGTQWDAANIGKYSVAIGEDVRASGDNATAFGLRSTAAQLTSFAAGEDNVASGASSVALGFHAHTNARSGSFVFSDRSSVDSTRAGVNHSATWRVSGGFRIYTSSNLSTGVTIQSGAVTSNWGQDFAVISTSTGAYLGTDGLWHDNSSVVKKRDFAAVDGNEVLNKLRYLPVQTWSYKTDDPSIRHMGPMAQTFYSVFGFGPDNKTIAPIDEGGVALAAVKALDAKSVTLKSRADALEKENAELKARLKRLEEAVAELSRSSSLSKPKSH